MERFVKFSNSVRVSYTHYKVCGWDVHLFDRVLADTEIDCITEQLQPDGELDWKSNRELWFYLERGDQEPPRLDIQGLCKATPGVLKEYFEDMMHNSFDGWELTEQEVISRLIDDIELYQQIASQQRQAPIVVMDNRDQNTTWLWLNETDYVEVDPADLYRNMVENCFEEADGTLDTADLQDMIDYLTPIALK